MNRLLRVPRIARPSTRSSHSLIVPYSHNPLVKFVNGVPAEQVRELTEYEKKWDFWTTSTSFYERKPITRGLVTVPAGESWVVERFGKFSQVLQSGTHVLLPLIDQIKAVKPTIPVSMDGLVDVYAVTYFKVIDAQASTYYRDPQTNKPDSERSAARIVREALENEIANVEAKAGLSASARESLAEKVLTRGAYDVAESVPARIRAYEAPHPDFEAPGHHLSNDYWSEYLLPPFFTKVTYGSNKQPVTIATPSLEWNIPSPPDFHHFNQQPKVAVAPEAEDLAKLGLKAH
ncbi:hypothetical protein HK103_006083 [Boothiomyces macroporosus]|uniref:Band 7 domain-containing protein n=1 Tax=Boothiomyces macroporosus TaxID=261099 RepID=A0AAD5UE79_9FUNG|nr:hypothetical protein HK103_006083 [Boothiomyces macroporosus]